MGLVFDAPTGGLEMMAALYKHGIWAIVAGFDRSVLQFKPGPADRPRVLRRGADPIRVRAAGGRARAPRHALNAARCATRWSGCSTIACCSPRTATATPTRRSCWTGSRAARTRRARGCAARGSRSRRRASRTPCCSAGRSGCGAPRSVPTSTAWSSATKRSSRASRTRPPGSPAWTCCASGSSAAATAEQAVEVITGLLETHGQGGGCGHEHRGFTYHNSFLVADPPRRVRPRDRRPTLAGRAHHRRVLDLQRAHAARPRRRERPAADARVGVPGPPRHAPWLRPSAPSTFAISHARCATMETTRSRGIACSTARWPRPACTPAAWWRPRRRPRPGWPS